MSTWQSAFLATALLAVFSMMSYGPGPNGGAAEAQPEKSRLRGYEPLTFSGQAVSIEVNDDLSLDIQDKSGRSLWNGEGTYAPQVRIRSRSAAL